MLGVLVLVVVMAVYAGLERNIKDRVLGFTPHVQLVHHDPASEGKGMTEWKATADKAKKFPHVKAATAYVSDHVIVDYESWQRPVLFHAVDSSDPAQVHGIEKMLDLSGHPKSTADFGLEDNVVISSTLAGQLHITTGNKIKLYSTRNFEEVMRTYKATEKPVLREAFADVWKKSTEALHGAWKKEGESFILTFADCYEIYDNLEKVYNSDIRAPEQSLLLKILKPMEDADKDEAKERFTFTPDAKASMEQAIDELNKSDAEKMDAETLKGLKSFVLPKEVSVIGVYKASQMAMTPDVFAPLPLAQDLAGLEGSVQGIALRLDNPYIAEQFAQEMRQKLGPDYSLRTWGDEYKPFFVLIEQQRSMMYFMLSFIVLISAFSMMAVMFTVTIQKRREIGVMKALGATSGQIIRVFLYQGMILGILGAILGVGLGRLVIHYRGHIQAALRAVGFDPFSSSFTGFDVLPAHHNIWEQITFAIMAFILCSLAAFVPAFFAARSDAAKSLRNL